MNWAILALTVLTLLIAAWSIAAARLRPGPVSAIAGLAHVLTAGVNSAAPVRGAADPGYIGYSFGLIEADRGWPVSVAAGLVVLAATCGAFAALGKTPAARGALFATSAFFALNIGGGWAAALGDPIAVRTIQFGEYLTISPPLSDALLFLLLVLPFMAGAIVGARRFFLSSGDGPAHRAGL